MNIVLKIILVGVICFVAYGFYVNSNEAGQGEKFIGIGVSVFAFILLPLFVYHRYKNKDLSRYTFQNHRKNKDEN